MREISRPERVPGDEAFADAGASTLAAQVYERIRYDIILVVLQPGQKLTLDLLKERYDVGMTPLREALYRLSASMLVLLEDRRGFHVAPISPAHLAEVIKSREEVEVLLLRDALQRGGVAWEEGIVAKYHALMRAGEYRPNPGPYTAQWEEAHRSFHYAILGAARLPMLEAFHRSLWDHCARYRNLAYEGRPLQTPVFEGHKQIMDAVLAHDAPLAEVLLRRHISLATSHIMGSLFPQEQRSA